MSGQDEVDALDRVLTRLAMTEETRLEGVLDKLLPRLLSRLGESDAIRAKTLQVLQHINKRVKDSAQIKLPCFALVDMALPAEQGTTNSFTASFSLVYLELGADRLASGEKTRLLPKLFRGLARLPEMQQSIVFRIIATILPFVSISGDMSLWFEEGTSESDKSIVLSFFLDWMFYQPPQQQVGAGATAGSVPPGLTPARVVRLKKKDGSLPDGSTLAQIQVAILKLICSGAFRSEDVLPHLIVGRSALRHEVVSSAEQNMARILKTVDLNDPYILLSLMNLVLPTIRPSMSSTFAPSPNSIDGAARKPCITQIRERAMSILIQGGSVGLREVADQGCDLAEHCVVTSQSSSQLRVYALEFSQLIVRACTKYQLEASNNHTKLFNLLQHQLEQVKQLSRGEINSIKEREATYSSLGTFAIKFPELFKRSVILVADLMKLLELEPEIRITIQEALGGLCDAFSEQYATSSARTTVKSTMMTYINSSQPKARLVVADWLRRLFPFQDTEARFACVKFSCDPDLATRQVAIRGLLPELCGNMVKDANENDEEEQDQTVLRAKRRAEKFAHEATRTLGEAAKLEPGRLALAWTDTGAQAEENLILSRAEKASMYPSLKSWMECLKAEGRIDSLLVQSERSADVQNQLASLIGFSCVCLIQNQRARIEVEKTQLATFRSLLESCLEMKDLTQTRTLHRVASRSLVSLVELHSTVYPVEKDWLLQWLAADSSVVRENVAMLVPYCKDATDDTFIDELLSRISKKVISQAHARHGALLAVGRLLSSTMSKSAIPTEMKKDLSESLVSTLLETSKARIVTLACVEAVGLAAESGNLLLSPKSLGSLIELLDKVTRIDLASSGDPELDGASTALLQAGLDTLGKLAKGAAIDSDKDTKSLVIDALFRAGEQKQAEVQLVVGQALTGLASKSESDFSEIMDRILSGAARSTKNLVRSASAIWLLVLTINFGSDPFTQQYLEPIHATFANLLRERSELTRECAARGMAWVFQSAVDPAIKSELVTSLARHMAAKSLFLSEVKKEQEKEKARKAKAEELGADYTESQMRDQDDEEDEDNEDPKAKEERMEEQARYESGGVSTSATPSSSSSGTDSLPKHPAVGGPSKVSPLNTVYKEVFQVAMKVGKPALTYRLLYHSAGDPFWSTSLTRHLKCATYEIDQIEGPTVDNLGKKVEDLDMDIVEKLIPILYHYKYDMEAHIKDTMTKLWATITMDMGTDNEILKIYLSSILPAVLANISSTKFRERHGGALALANIIRESDDGDMMSSLEKMWKLSLRLVDDLNEATRVAAALLAKEVSNLTVRLCSFEDNSSKEKKKIAKDSLEIVLPYLLEKGLVDQSKDGQAIAVHTLARVVKVCKENIRPSITDVIIRLLDSMSALEDQTLQYAMFHTNDQGGDLNVSREQLESMRVQAFNESPMQQAVDICIDQIPPGDSLADLAPELAKLARVGVGLPTMASTSRAISRLAARRDLEPALQNHAVVLLRGLAHSLNDRSAMIRKSFASTAAAVARVAEPAAVKEYVKVLRKLYSDPGDEKSRLTVASALRELLQRAPDLFNELNKYLLPLLFLARYDDDEDIAAAYRQIWSENAGTVQNGVSSRLHLLVPFCVSELESTMWLRKRQAAEGLRDIVSAVEVGQLQEFAEPILDGLSRALPGRLWNGKESLLVAVSEIWCKLFKGSFHLKDSFSSPHAFCTTVLIPECYRESASPAYLEAAFHAIYEVCQSNPPKDSTTELSDLISSAISNFIDGDGKVNKPASLVAKAFESLGASYQANSNSLVAILDQSQQILRGTNHVVATGVCNCLKSVFRVCPMSKDEDMSNLKVALDICWRCIVENKNPTAICASLLAMNSLFSRSDLPTTPEFRQLSSSCLTRLQPLLSHRESSVVHAASTLNSALSRAVNH